MAGMLLNSSFNRRKDRLQYLSRRSSIATGNPIELRLKQPRSFTYPGKDLDQFRHETCVVTQTGVIEIWRKKVDNAVTDIGQSALHQRRRHTVEFGKPILSSLKGERSKVQVSRMVAITPNQKFPMSSYEERKKFEKVPGGKLLKAARSGNLDKVVHLLEIENIDINTSNSTGLTALLLATKEGHYDVVRALIERGASPNQATKLGNTALHIASLAGNLPILKLLIRKGADLNAIAQNSFTPLYMAAQEGHANIVNYLVQHGADYNIPTADGFTPLAVALQEGRDAVVNLLLTKDGQARTNLSPIHIAAKKDDVKFAMLLLHSDDPDNTSAKAMLNATSESGFTALHIAAHYGNSNVGEVLVDKGAVIDFKAKNGITPLHVAAKRGHLQFCSFLLDRHARVDISTRDGLVPLFCAARAGHLPVVELLLAHKEAPKFAKTKSGLSVLHMAVQGGHSEVVDYLLDDGYPIDGVSSDYLSSLHMAAHCGHTAIVGQLLERGAYVDSKARHGFTPLHVACKKGRLEVVQLLIENEADKEAQTKSGLSPLIIACFMGHLSIVKFLTTNNVNLDLQNVNGETALDVAIRAEATDVVKFLTSLGAPKFVPKLSNGIGLTEVSVHHSS